MAAYMNSDRWLNRRQMENNVFLFRLCYKRNGKRCSCATMELCMHLGGLLSTQEARVADSYASFVLRNLPRASITPCLHAARFLIRTLSINSSKCLSQLVGLSRRVTPRSFRYNTRLMVTIGSGGGHGCSSFYDKFLGLTSNSPQSRIFYLLSAFGHQGTLGGATSIINHDSKNVQVPEQCLGAHLDWQARMGLWLCLHIPFADDILKSQ